MHLRNDGKKKPLLKKQKFAMKLNELINGLVYTRFLFDGKSLTRFQYHSNIIHNMFDVYEITKKQVYKYRNQKKYYSNFQTAIAKNISEHNFNENEDLRFHSKFESGNLLMVVKVN